MIRITKEQSAGNGVVFRVEGKLDAEGVRELKNLIASSGARSPLAIDVSGVTSIQVEGSTFLKDLQRSGCRLFGGSMYLNRLLGVVES